jgi:hypothetical protein
VHPPFTDFFLIRWPHVREKKTYFLPTTLGGTDADLQDDNDWPGAVARLDRRVDPVVRLLAAERRFHALRLQHQLSLVYERGDVLGLDLQFHFHPLLATA